MSIALTLPWGAITHDNHRLVPAGKGRKGLVSSSQYRLRKQAAVHMLTRQFRGVMLTGDVQLHARLYFPDHRKRDVTNYSKLLCDAMSGIIYSDDSQLACATWERGGYDKDNPRVEIILKEYTNGVSNV